MTQPDQLTDAEIRAAVRILFEEACYYEWWPISTKSFDEFAAKDPVAVSELTGIAERMLIAASAARKIRRA